MKIKKALLVTLSMSLFATTLISTNYVNAEESDEENKASSEVHIKFTAPTDPTAPLDPSDPNQLLFPDETTGVVTGIKGPLSLNYVSHIYFEDATINVENAKYESVTENPNIQVSDNRGFGYGWHVTAEAKTFKNGEEEPSLPGSKIFLNGGTAQSPGTSDEPEVNKNIELVTGGSSDWIVNSVARVEDSPQGLGEWIIKWISTESTSEKNNNVILDVPTGAATEGKHVGTIEWTLSDGPYN